MAVRDDPGTDDLRSHLMRLPDPLLVLAELFAHAPLGLQILSRDGRAAVTSRAWAELFGERTGAVPVSENPLLARLGVVDALGRALHGEVARVGPCWVAGATDGQRRAISFVAFPLYQGHQVSHLVVLAEDETEDQNARARSRQLSERLRALLELAASDLSDLDATVRRVLHVDAHLLGVEQVSFWRLLGHVPGERRLRCEVLLHRDGTEERRGTEVDDRQAPAYFDALLRDAVIDADLVHLDPRTRELRSVYTGPRGVSSLLDVPIWSRGRLIGVVCHEHVGEPRRWSLEDKTFALSVASVVTVGIHLCERQLAERALRNSEERLRLLIEGLDDHALVTLDRDGRIEGWNVGAERMFGIPDTQALGRPVSSLLAEPEEVSTVLALARQHGRYEDLGWHARSDASRFFGSVVVRPTQGAEQDGGFVAVAHDLSDRRALEEAFELTVRSLDLQETLSAVARLGVPRLADVCLVDMLEGAEVRMAVARHAEPRELLDELLSQLQQPGRVPAVPIASARRNGSLVRDLQRSSPALGLDDCPHLQLLRGLGCTSSVTLSIFGREGVLGRLVLATHAPGRRMGHGELHLARELANRAGLALDNARLYRQAQQAVRAREDIMAVVSHDLRNLLSVMQLNARLLERHGGLSEERRRHVVGILRANQRMQRMIGDLLDVGRIEAGRLVLNRRLNTARGLLVDASELLQPLALEKGVQLEVVLPGEGARVHCDRERVLQVFSNLVGNAIKFTPSGGRILLRGELHRDELRFSVADTGPGIPHEQLAHLFERYTHGREAGSGAGLGLFIVQGLVRAHGGRVWVESAPGRGSTFLFSLPLAIRPDEQLAPFAPGG